MGLAVLVSSVVIRSASCDMLVVTSVNFASSVSFSRSLIMSSVMGCGDGSSSSAGGVGGWFSVLRVTGMVSFD